MLEERSLRTVKAIFLFAVLCLFCVAGPVFATERVDQSNMPEWAGGWTNINPDPNGQASMWQTFTPEYSNVTAVEIDILTVNPGWGDDTLTVEIARDGQILAWQQRSVEDGYDGLFRFEFDKAVPVIPGELYELKVHDTGKTQFGWKYASNTYDAGSRYVFASERSGTDWLFLTYSAVEPRIIYVDDGAAGANDGTSWEDAYVYLQDALADANSAEKPVEIKVAQGIYKPDQGVKHIPGYREATFQLINGVTLKGGYAGLENGDPNIRDTRLNETILSGDLNGDDIRWNELMDIKILPNYNSYGMATFDEPNREDNTYNVVTGSNTDGTAALDGFTISGGCAGGFDYSGGGMYNNAGSPTIVDCTFTRNVAYYCGGGIYCENNSNPTLTNCTISRNWALFSGGMYNESSNPSLINCIFNENFSEVHSGASVEGYHTCGGMHNSYSNPTLTDCTFNENSASWLASQPAGGMLNLHSDPNITNCIFKGNKGCRGGGIHNIGSNPVLTNCVFIRNSVENEFESEGGAIFNESLVYIDRSWTEHIVKSNPIFRNCVFTGNLAENGGGMANFFMSNPILINCIFSGNTAISSGGGIYNRGGSVILTNCTLSQNSAQNGNALTALTSNSYRQETPSNVELINCILWNGGNEVWNDANSTINVTYSNIQGGFQGKGYIDVDPLFASLGYWIDINDSNIVAEPNDPNAIWIDGDYHLKSQAGRWDSNSQSWVMDDITSPCIDAGDPNSPVGDEPEPNGGRINMGAYGGTAEASKSYMSELFQTTEGFIRASCFKAVK